MTSLQIWSFILITVVVVSAVEQHPYGNSMETLLDVNGTDIRLISVKFDPLDPERLLLIGVTGVYSMNPTTGERDHIYPSNKTVYDVTFLNKNDAYILLYNCIMKGIRSTLTGSFDATVLIGNCSHTSFANGPFLESRFNLLRKVKSYGEDKLIMLDRRNGRLRVADLKAGNMTDMYSVPGWCGDFTDDPASKHHIYLVNKHMLVRYDMRDQTSIIVAGTGQEANAAGSGGEARFSYPWSLFTLNKRDLIILDMANKEIKLVQDYNTASSFVSAKCTDHIPDCTSMMEYNPQMGLLATNGFYVVNNFKLFYIPHQQTENSVTLSGSTYIRDSTACSLSLEYKPFIIGSSVMECADRCSKMIYCTAFLRIENLCYIEPAGVGVIGGVKDNNCYRRVLL